MPRTNIELDDDLVKAVMSRYGFKSEREAVHAALRQFAEAPMTREEALAMRGSGWEGDLEMMRNTSPR